jgi:hypothetical protein
MNILHAVGCIAAAVVASAAAIPIGAICASLGFTGFAALFGAVVVVSIIQ